MGAKYIRTLSDVDKHGMVIEITCWKCQRKVYRRPSDLIGLQLRQGRIFGWLRIEDLSKLLVCKGGRGAIGCTAKEPEVRPLWPHELPRVPAGVPIVDFLNGDDRERRRLVRQARS